MKSIFLLVAMTLIGLGVVSTQPSGRNVASADVASEYTADPTPSISTNEGGCWDKCKTCEEKCRGKSGDAQRACNDACWNTNDGCCSAVGGKGVYKMCGCKDK